MCIGPAARAEQYVVAIGKGLTGLMSFVGVPETNGIRLAAEQLEARHFLGEGNHIELRVFDDAGDRNQLMTLVSKAATLDNALMFLGPASSGVASAVSPMVNELKMPMMAPAIATEPLKYGPWYMKITTSPEGSIRPVGRYAVDKMRVKRPAIVFCRDNDGHITNARTFREIVTAAGLKVAADETVLTSDTDFTAVATKIAAADPDSIFVAANDVQAANIVTQLKQAGVGQNVAIFGSSGLGTNYIKSGGPLVDNTYVSTDYNSAGTSPMNLAFQKDYRERFGLAPDNWSAVGYSEMLITAQAIKNAQPAPTRAKVLEAIQAMRDVSVLLGAGTWSMGPDRIPLYEMQIVKVQNGTIVPAP